MLPGLYVHVPFCRSKCPYCGFYSVPSMTPIPIWFHGIKKEILLYRGYAARFDSLYIGGGTPSFLDEQTLTGLIDHLFMHFDFAGDTEFTIEANPCDLTDRKIRLLRDLGCNRVNVGVQSFDDAALAFLGRSHTARDARSALARLQSTGTLHVGLDLIYGLPGQTREAWIDQLKIARSFDPAHISCYELTMEKGTPFDKQRAAGRIRPVDEDEGRSCFLAASEVLGGAGYVHYEVSNYARTEACCSRHNGKYWAHIPYLGLGPSAHSFDGKERWWNIRSIRRYRDALEKGRLPMEGRETLTREQMRIEALALGFRTRNGVALEHLGAPPSFSAALQGMKADGLVTVCGNRVAPTEEGFLVADYLPACFF